MGRKKDPEKKTRIEEIRENLDREQKEFVSAQSLESKEEEAANTRNAFRIFWSSNRKKYNKPRDLEDVLWAHIKSAGFDKPELFTKGLEHFGLKK